MFAYPTEPTRSKLEAAEREGYARGLAASNLARPISITVSGLCTVPEYTGKQGYVTFSLRQDTPIAELLSEIQQRLPKTEHDFVVMTMGRNPQQLAAEPERYVMEFLEPWDAAFLRLRVANSNPPPKKSLGSRLRKALGGGSDRSAPGKESPAAIMGDVVRATSSHGSVRSAPPAYESVMDKGK